MIHESDYNGYPNWETWHSALVVDNEYELYQTVREIVKNNDRQAFDSFMQIYGAEPTFEHARNNWPHEKNEPVDYDFLWNHYRDELAEEQRYMDETPSELTLPWGEEGDEYYRNAKQANDGYEFRPARVSDEVMMSGWPHLRGLVKEVIPADDKEFFCRACNQSFDSKWDAERGAVCPLCNEDSNQQDRIYMNHDLAVVDWYEVDPDQPLGEVEPSHTETQNLDGLIPVNPENRKLSSTRLSVDMPQFRDDDGELWVWDAASKSYVHTRGDALDHPRGWSTGGDNHLFDPASHRYKAKNPLQEGILASQFDKCKDCGGKINAQGDCIDCHARNDKRKLESPQMHTKDYPFFEREPKPNMMRTDNDFPTKMTYKSSEGHGVNGVTTGSNMKRHEFSHIHDELDYKKASKPNLENCPECGAPMVDKNNEAMCHDCGHRQPIIHTEASQQKEAVYQLIPMALRALAPSLLGGAAEGAGAAGAAGLAGGAEAAGAGEIAGGVGQAAKGMLSPGNLMRGALTRGGMGIASDALKSLGDIQPDTEHGGMYQASFKTVARGSGGDNNSDDIFSDEKDLGEDDHPENDGTRDFQRAVSDNPEFLKDVAGPGATLDPHDPFNPMKPYKNRQHAALSTFENSLPLVLFYADSEESGEDNPVLKALDELMEEAFPGYKDVEDDGMLDLLEMDQEEEHDEHHEEMDAELEDEAEDEEEEKDEDEEELEEDDEDELEEKKSHVATSAAPMGAPAETCPVCGQVGDCPHKPAQPKSGPMSPGSMPAQPTSMPMAKPTYASMEFIAARRPHMCPHHRNLVDTALALGDPAGALGALAQHQFGEHSCQGSWQGEKSCRFKPAMITQAYWDEKAQKAQERKELREQQALAEQPAEQFEAVEPTAETEQSAETFEAPEPTAQNDSFSDNVIEMDLSGGYSPSSDGMDSAVGGGEMQIAANAVFAADDADKHISWKDDQGNPIKEGSEYLLKAPDYEIPDRVTIDAVNPDKLTYTVHTDMMEYRDQMSRHEAADQGYEFISAGSDEAESMDDSMDGFDGGGHNDAHDEFEDAYNVHARLMDKDDEPELPLFEKRAWLLEGTEHVAGRDFSPTEQRRFIDEPGQARNLDRLDLAGTHYVESNHVVPEEHKFLW